MTKQEIFNKVYAHLLKQGVKSEMLLCAENPVVKVMQCAYRGENGTMCAAGCLIPDELYRPSMESRTVVAEEVAVALHNAGVVQELGVYQCGQYRSDDLVFIHSLQTVHDDHEPEDWKARLAYVAGQHGLTVPELP
jgi:hypothetical protein